MLRVHLMSAGRLRYLKPGARGRRRRCSGSASRTAASSSSPRRARRSARASGSSPRAPRGDLAHLGPDALELDEASLADILTRERRQLHPLLRDQRAIAGIGRAHANEILRRAHLSPFKLSTELSRRRSRRLARRSARTSRALELREQGKGDADVYLVHKRLGEPCPECGTPIARVDYEEHTVYYCPSCQTGGRLLKDRRSRVP